MSEISRNKPPLSLDEMDHSLIGCFIKAREYELAYRAVQAFIETREMLRAVSDSLPRDTHRILGRTNGCSENAIYVYDVEKGEWVYRSTIATDGRDCAFIGDGIEEIFGGAVALVNSDLGLALQVNNSVNVRSLESLRSHVEGEFERLLEMIDRTPAGERTSFDCLWY